MLLKRQKNTWSDVLKTLSMVQVKFFCRYGYLCAYSVRDLVCLFIKLLLRYLRKAVRLALGPSGVLLNVLRIEELFVQQCGIVAILIQLFKKTCIRLLQKGKRNRFEGIQNLI